MKFPKGSHLRQPFHLQISLDKKFSAKCDSWNSKRVDILDKIPKKRPSWIFSNSLDPGHVAKHCRVYEIQKGGHLEFSKFQKGGFSKFILDFQNSKFGFFQIVFGSKNVAKQSCRSMKFQKGGHLGFFKIPKRWPSWIISNSVQIQKCCLTKL